MQNAKFKAALFDIDGTLLDTEELLFQAFQHVLAVHNQPYKSREEIGQFIGRHIAEIYENIAPGVDTDMLRKTHSIFQKSNLHLAKVYPNTKATLVALKKAGLYNVAVTNRFRTAVDSLQITGILDDLDLVIKPEDVVNLKPHPESILKVLEHFKLTKDEVVFIGDSKTDMLTGKNAGVVTIGVTYGFHKEKIREDNPDYVVDDISEILPIIVEK